MPKYNFTCPDCLTDKHAYVTKDVESIDCNCGNKMIRRFPKSTTQSEVRELVDPLRNVTWSKDHQALMKDRRDTHYWEVEVPRLVETHSVETSLEQGWLVYNDKGELVINKPPSKR